jgi:hypothetical protein
LDPVPYRIRDEDIDEVLSEYDTPDDVRSAAHAHVMRHVLDIADIVRTAPETPSSQPRLAGIDFEMGSEDPGDLSPDRREAALAGIEDLLLRDGFLELSAGEQRLFPISTRRDSERADG